MPKTTLPGSIAIIFVHERSPAIADRFFSQVQTAIKQVSKTPKIGQPKTLKNPKLAGLRSWPVNGFPAIRIYYVVRDSGLLIIRVLHNKRDIDPLLEDDPVEEL